MLWDINLANPGESLGAVLYDKVLNFTLLYWNNFFFSIPMHGGLAVRQEVLNDDLLACYKRTLLQVLLPFHLVPSIQAPAVPRLCQ
jgi:hypothetical protein